MRSKTWFYILTIHKTLKGGAANGYFTGNSVQHTGFRGDGMRCVVGVRMERR